MALIKCNECENEVSDKAATCPKCGAPIEKKTSKIPEQPKEEAKTSISNSTKTKKNSWKIIAPFLGIAIIAFIFFANNNNSSNNSVNNSLFSSPQTIEKTPEELRQELLLKEQQSPSEYITHKGVWRENFWGLKVLEGTLSNSATMANFKDIVLTVTWLTKTETELKTENYTIYEYVQAGKSINYKLKVNAPSATAGVRIGIDSATPVD